MASHRAELLGRLAGAQFQLEALIAELRHGGNGAELAASEDGLLDLAALQRRVATADPATLTTLRHEVAATIGTVTTNAQQARAAASASAASGEVARVLAEAGAASRARVTATMAGMRDFDRDLQFRSKDDEDAYRQREAERRAYVEAQQARHTPEGDLNAAGGAVGQMVDASAHGAGENPAFQQRWNELVATTQRLRDEVRRSGGSTQEFDDRLRTDLRGILQRRGLTDAQIDAQFAAHRDDPLAVARVHVAEEDMGTLDCALRSADHGARMTTGAAVLQTASELAGTNPMAEFRAAGIVLAQPTNGDAFVHGVNAPRANAAGRAAPTHG